MLVRNWTNTDLNKFTVDLSNLDIHYNSKPILIQIPKGFLISHPQVFNNPKLRFLNISVSYNSNKHIKSFVEYIKSVEGHIFKQYKTKSSKKFSSSIRLANENTRIYFNLNIQIYNNEAILSIFDPYKNKQSIDYIIPQSSAICLVCPKCVWKSHNKLGINWVLVQTKIFQPIIKLDQCLIMDDFEDNPVLHYHSNNSPDNKINSPRPKLQDTNNDGFEKKYDKFIKMKKMGIPIGAIEIEMTKFPDHSIKEFKNHFGIEDDNIPLNPRPKIIIKKNPPQPKPPSTTSGHTSSAFRPPTANELTAILKKLKPVN
jgi:hypothetical protein